jgi:hypothetical protein
MKQLEIQYFFPLTEQIPLDLDYKPCYDYEAKKRADAIAGSVLTTCMNGGTIHSNISLESAFQFKPSPDCVGYWEVTPSIQVWRKEKPNWLHKKYTEFMLGWKWNNR